MKREMKYIALCLWLLSSSASLFGQKRVYQIDLDRSIDPPAWRLIQQGFKGAEQYKAALVILRINTYGGMVEYADSIRTFLMQHPIPVWAFIDNNAASAGSLIAIACDSIYMRKSATMGATSVVNQSGTVMPDKYQSYMRATMRATAEAQGRDPKIAEAMVGESRDSSGTFKVLTLTADEAVDNGYCEGIVESVDELLRLGGVEQYQLEKYKPGTIDKIIGFLISPAISGLLILLIAGGIYFELQTPGVGFPLIVSVAAALLYFAPLYIEGLAANWEIILFIVGLGLLAVEVFVLPGFGIAGISGLILIVAGLSLSLIGNQGFEFSGLEENALLRALALVIGSLTGSIIASIWLGGRLLKSNMLSPIVVTSEQRKEEGYVAADLSMSRYIGSKGKAITVLRPSGKVLIDGKSFDCVSRMQYIEAGTMVEVVGFENNQLIVAPLTA